MFGVVVHDALDEADRVLRASHRHVRVDPHPVGSAHRFANPAHRLDVRLHALAGLDLDGAKAFPGALARELRHLDRLAVRHRVAEGDAIAHPAAEERVDRHPERLAGEVPQGHFHSRDRELAVRELGLHGPHVARARDLERVAADEGGSEAFVHVAAKERAAPREHARKLAEAREALVRAHLDDPVLGDGGGPERGTGDLAVGREARHEDRRRLDGGDLHDVERASCNRAGAGSYRPRGVPSMVMRCMWRRSPG